MEYKLYRTSFFMARIKSGSKVVILQQSVPVKKLNRRDISFLQGTLNIPVYPDQTNVGQENTRAQLRYSLFPLIENLGFDSFGQQLEKLITLQQKNRRLIFTGNQTTRESNKALRLQSVVVSVKGHVTFELPGTRTQNCPVKSRELYH